MTDSRIQPGAFVWYAPKGMGQVEETGGSLSVLFWIDRKSGKTEKFPPNLLTPLADYIPEAKPPGKAGGADPWKRFESGIKKAPLKLIALALSACGNVGGTADIKEKLDRRAPVGPWGSWWKRTEPKLHELPSHFKIDGAGEDVKYALLSSVADVPADWIEPKVTLADWKKWLSTSVHEPPPGRFPTKPVADVLAKWPAKTIEQALDRVTVTAEGLLPSGSVSPQAAEGWLRAVAQASLRWREVADPDPLGHRAARIGTLLARLSRIAGDRTPQDLLLRAGALDGEADAWRRGFAAGMWESFVGEDARDIYLKSSAVLWRQAREDLAREIALAAFDPSYSTRRNYALDRLLDVMPEGDRPQLIGELIALSARGPKSGVLDYIANSRHAAKSEDAPERLTLLALATLLLSDGQGEVSSQASREMASAFDAPDGGGPAFQSLFRDTRAYIAEDYARKDAEMKSQRKVHAAELEHEQREQDRLRERVETLRNQLFAGYEQSKLDIRQDMLVIVGELSQLADKQDCPSEDFLRDMRAGLALALQAGDAKTLGVVGDIARFDPLKHQATESVRIGDSVKITTPGIIAKGKRTDDRVLVKAQVSGISEKR